MHFSTLITTTAALAAGLVSAHHDHPPMDREHPFSYYSYENSWKKTTSSQALLHKHAASKQPHMLHPHHHHHTAGGRAEGRDHKTHRARQEAAATEIEVAAEPYSSASTSKEAVYIDIMPRHTRDVSLTVIVNDDASTATSEESATATSKDSASATATATLSLLSTTSAEPTATDEPILPVKKAVRFGTVDKKKISMNHDSTTAFDVPQPTLPPIFPTVVIPKPFGFSSSSGSSDEESPDTVEQSDSTFSSSDEEGFNVPAGTVTVTKARTVDYAAVISAAWDPLAAAAVITPGPKEPHRIDIEFLSTVDVNDLDSFLHYVYASLTFRLNPRATTAMPEFPHSIVTIGTHTLDLADVRFSHVSTQDAKRVAPVTSSGTGAAPVATPFAVYPGDPNSTSPSEDESSSDDYLGPDHDYGHDSQ